MMQTSIFRVPQRTVFYVLLFVSTLISCSTSDDSTPPPEEPDTETTDPNTTPPANLEIITSDGFDIRPFAAILGGQITNDSELTLTERGIVWSLSPNPTEADHVVIDDSGTGASSFDLELFCLDITTQHYVRAYARTSNGIFYGNEVSFTTLDHKTFAGDVTLNNQNELDSFAANEYSKIEGTLRINANNGDISLEALRGLTEVTGELTLFEVAGTEGLNCLKSVGALLGMTGVPDYTGFSKLERVEGNLIISDGRSGDLTDLNPLQHIGGSFEFNSEPGTSIGQITGLDGVTNLGKNSIDYSIFISSYNVQTINILNEVSNALEGDVIFNDMETSLSIEGFAKVPSLPWLEFNQCSGVSIDISGFAQLNEVEVLSIRNCGIAEFGGLHSLTSIHRNLLIDYFTDNPAQLTLSGLNGVTRIGDDSPGFRHVGITAPATNAVEITGLQNLTEVRGNIDINSPTHGSGINLPNLTIVDGYIQLIENSNTTMSGLQGLQTVGRYIQITCNDNLQNLDGLENLVGLGETLFINGNPQLTDLCGITNLVQNGLSDINYNGVCGPNGYEPTVQDILNGDCAL